MAEEAARYRADGEGDRVAEAHEKCRATDEEELGDLLDRLGNRFGFGRIGRPVPHQSWLPERAAIRRGVGDRNGGHGSGVADRLSPGPLPAPAADWPEGRRRPLRLLSPPEPVEATAPESGGPPPSFRRRGRSHRLRAAEGPERLECEWWREDGPRRDYYLVEDETGCRYWLFREGGGDSEGARACGRMQDPEGGSRWFLHGVFG